MIGGLIIFEYFTQINLPAYLRATIPGVDYEEAAFYYVRAGFYRVNGIDTAPVQTGYRLAFLFPLTIWYAVRKFNFIRALPLILTGMGFVFLQTRAAIVGVLCAMLLLFVLIESRHKFYMLILATFFVAVLSFTPIIIEIGQSFITESLAGLQYGSSSLTLEHKLNRVPVAIDLIKKRPFSGYGSPHYAYFEIMQTSDLPAPLIYALAGGLSLFLIYMAMIFFMPLSMFWLSRQSIFSPEQRIKLVYIAAAFVGGIVPLFSNNQEIHFWIMFTLYSAITKVYISKKKDITLEGTNGLRIYRNSVSNIGG